MKLRLLCVGRIAEPWLRDGIEEYAGRLQRYLPLTVTELKEEKGGRQTDPARIRSREGERLLEKLPARGAVIVLDEHGERLSSAGLAERIERHMVGGTAELTFVIGGAYGLSEPVKARGELLSLSPMTLTHRMARLLLLEQLYRGLTIVRREPYHNA